MWRAWKISLSKAYYNALIQFHIFNGIRRLRDVIIQFKLSLIEIDFRLTFKFSSRFQTIFWSGDLKRFIFFLLTWSIKQSVFFTSRHPWSPISIFDDTHVVELDLKIKSIKVPLWGPKKERRRENVILRFKLIMYRFSYIRRGFIEYWTRKS